MEVKTFKEFLGYLSCCCSVTINTGNHTIYLNSNVCFTNFLRSVKGQTMADCSEISPQLIKVEQFQCNVFWVSVTTSVSNCFNIVLFVTFSSCVTSAVKLQR